jgi:hypothetical protein
LTSAYGRATFELRLPVGTSFTVRAGGGARAGMVWQQLTPRVPAPSTTNTAFALGPEAFFGGRFSLAGSLFVDVTATGALPFLRQEEALRGIVEVTASGSLGLRF